MMTENTAWLNHQFYNAAVPSNVRASRVVNEVLEIITTKATQRLHYQ